MTARKFFARNGALARLHPQFEFRPGQLEMAEAVESALADKRHLLVEAGTGTGKTLAYLAPAIFSGRRIVVSTGTKNLQEQLFFKDIPLLQQMTDHPLRVCYMKGRTNYACRQKIYDAEREPILSGLEEVADYQVIREWEKTTQTGDRSEIRTLPEKSTAWAKLDAQRDLCSGQRCQQFERCFLTQMRQRAHESDIIIVNHHLFFADLATKEVEFGGVIPEYGAVVFDEAHEIEDIAGQYFGISVSNHQFQDLTRDLSLLARRKNFASAELDRVLETVRDRVIVFFESLPRTEGRTGFRAHAEFISAHAKAYEDVLLCMEILTAQIELIRVALDELLPLARRARELAEKLKFWVEAANRSWVYWIERRGHGVFLQATPIDVSSVLHEKLFDTVDTVVLTSATLAVGGSFDFTIHRLGLRSPRTLIVPSHFDFESQTLLYVPQHLPDPRNPGFSAAASAEIVKILNLSRGRAFVLFTSYQQMRAIYDRVSLQVEYPTLMQGTGPRSVLLEEFRSTPNCVLFATSSFWQGVDVQGDQLSCVIIDKLPFAVPNDPVVEARIQSIRENGGNPFYDYQIPQAALALKQGFGRLIRGKKDRGVLALLDNRITMQRYGQVFFDSLPGYAFTTELNQVESFFDV